MDAREAMYLETMKNPKPMEPEAAAARLKEMKRIFDGLGVVFWLGSGTCLGAVREGRFIPWDDEMDTVCILGRHGLTEETVRRGIETFRDNGFYVKVQEDALHYSIALVKDGLRTDWTVHRPDNGQAYEYPGIRLPMHVFDDLKEIDFIGERFRVPNPPEEYLASKYGPDWRTPKGPGFESDVVGQVKDGSLIGRGTLLLWRLTGGRLPASCIRVRVENREGAVVPGATVRIAGVATARANGKGEARLPVPGEQYAAMIIEYTGHREVLYGEVVSPGARYTYRPGPVVSPEEHYKAGVRALALVKEQAQ